MLFPLVLTLFNIRISIASTIERYLHNTASRLGQCQFSPTFALSSLQCGALFQLLTNSKCLSKGLQLHAHAITTGNLSNNAYLMIKVTALYATCGQLADARLLFEGCSVKNSFVWNSMIRGYASCGFPVDAILVYREMVRTGRSRDHFTFPFVIKAHGELRNAKMGRKIHCEVLVNGFEFDVYVSNALLSMYGKMDDLGSARKVFDRMNCKDATSWNTLISCYVKIQNVKGALEAFNSMMKSGLNADSVTLIALLSCCVGIGFIRLGRQIHGYAFRSQCILHNVNLENSLIEMYSRCNAIVEARSVFDMMHKNDTVSWNSLIAGYARNEDSFKSLKTFALMVSQGSVPDQVTFVNVLAACNQITSLHFGMSIHACVVKKCYDRNPVVGSAIVDMYAKCGSLKSSRHYFNELPEKNLVTWSSMINGYGMHGEGREAVALFNEMLCNDIIPDGAVLTSVLSACSHSAMVSEGKEIFARMTSDWQIIPESTHYSCLVDLLGRGGFLDEAYETTQKIGFHPTSDIWAALLNACRVHKNFKLAKKLAEQVSFQVGSYVCLSNIYAAEKQWDEVEKVRSTVRKQGLTKPPGCSFVTLDKIVYRFLVGDKSHKQSIEIRAKLEELNQLLKECGYKPDTSSVLYNVEEELKERMLWEHSERLAIGFALINTKPGTIIRITKNLRVCSDCHSVIKLISKLTAREIVMRDKRRFHHIKDGECSCDDYW